MSAGWGAYQIAEDDWSSLDIHKDRRTRLGLLGLKKSVKCFDLSVLAVDKKQAVL